MMGLAACAFGWMVKEQGVAAPAAIAMALGIGVAQCLAMWPGVSRSLVTVLGGCLAGLSLGAWSALHAAGVLGFDDTLRVLEARGRSRGSIDHLCIGA
jgi:malonyl CoA-acyl carrier protein transacylase